MDGKGKKEMVGQLKGCVHIYCGDGKGKTSAAIGLAVRAAGRGKRVLMERFLKTDDSGEVAALRKVDGIDIRPCERTFGFTSLMSDKEREEAAVYYQERFRQAWRYGVNGGYDVVILDEVIGACHAGLVPEEDVLWALNHRPEALEVVLTGRNPSQALLEKADYISEIRMVRHPFTGGLAAREGIEY